MSKYVFVKINDDITSIKRLKEMFPKIEEEDFEDILASDPTYTNNAYEAGKYGKWLLSLFNKNNLKKEDLYKAKEYLEKFDKLKNKISNKDINTYKNLPDLYKVIEETESKSPTKSELKRNVQRTDLDKDAELYMETENFKIYIPKTYEASCKLGSDTQWCTATRSDRGYYDDYTSDGNELYVMISKKDPSEKYQWNTKERYTCDKSDEEITEIELCVRYPDLIKFFKKFGYDVEKTMQEIEEYKKGKEFIYDGQRVETDIAPYVQKAKISNDIMKIKGGAFKNCSSLTSIEIPNSVEIIGGTAFKNCSSLTSIEIPNSVTEIGYMAFYGCSSLRSIKLPNDLATIMQSSIFDGCSSLTNITIPEGVINISPVAFGGCKALKSIKLPNSVEIIDTYAFLECESLTSIELPNNLRRISDDAFCNCRSLTNITIPNSTKVISIAPTAFEGCSPDLVIKTKNPYVIEYCEAYNLKYSEE